MSAKFFEVEVTWTAIVEAESLIDAYGVAESCTRDITRDADGDVTVVREVTSLERLPEGWEGNCLPYGGDGDTRLQDLLPEVEPVRDTKTIDMFAGAAA